MRESFSAYSATSSTEIRSRSTRRVMRKYRPNLNCIVISGDLETYRKSAGKSCGLDKRYKHFPFLPFYRKAFAYLSDGEGGAFVKMIGAYMFENKAPTKSDGDAFKYFNICKRKLDESKQRMQNGAKGGRPKKNKNSPQESRVPEKCETSARKEDGNHS